MRRSLEKGFGVDQMVYVVRRLAVRCRSEFEPQFSNSAHCANSDEETGDGLQCITCMFMKDCMNAK